MSIQHSYLQHITTKALNSGKIKAMLGNGGTSNYGKKKSVYINRDYSLQNRENHDKAVESLLEHLEWDIKSIFSTEKTTLDGWIYILMGN